MSTLTRWLGGIGASLIFGSAAGFWPTFAFLMGWWGAMAFLMITRQWRPFA